jgi:amidase
VGKRLTTLMLLMVACAGAQAQFDSNEASIAEMQDALANGQTTSVELVRQYLARIEAYDKQGPALNSIVRVNPQALSVAEALDRERANGGPRSALHGIPILVKDNYNTTMMPTTGGSVALADFVPNANATQIQKLIDAGAIILAKTNLHEYAYGITTVGSLFGQTKNPYDIRRVPGGSSGGTGAAVAANFGAIGLGSDTCGSIRIPASFNNLIGLRPSKGLSSIYGVMPLSHTQDVAGPLARSAEDLATLLDVVIGYDNRDSATELVRDRPLPQFRATLGSASLADLRMGKLSSYMEDSAGAIQQNLEAALDWYAQQGAEVVEVEIADLAAMISASGLITQEFQVDLNAYLNEFGAESFNSLAQILEAGLYHEAVAGPLLRSAGVERDDQAYQERVLARETLRSAVLQYMAEHRLDAIVYPTISQLPVQIGDAQTGSNCSLSANSGLPALSMPVGFSSSGLPVGMELLGGELADAQLLAIAYAYEQANLPRKPPPVTPPLIDGVAPTGETLFVSFDEAGLELEAVFEFYPTRNELRFTVVRNASSSAQLHAVTLVIIEDEGGEASGVTVHNLLAPAGLRATGSYYMSAAFRQAFEQDRVGIRVFAEGLPPGGVIRSLR